MFQTLENKRGFDTGAKVGLAVFGVNEGAGVVLVAFLKSSPHLQTGRLAGVAPSRAGFARRLAIHSAGINLYLRRASRFFLGHWPQFNNPDPKELPDHFQPQSEFLEFLPTHGVLGSL